MLRDFLIPGKASFICGGQWGSEAKGAAAAWVADQLSSGRQIGKDTGRFDIVTTNAGAQAGHTSIHNGKKAVVFHLPTAPLITPGSLGYLNAGAIIDPEGLRTELEAHSKNFSEFFIHPNATIITQACRDAEGRADSAQTAIASTRKGVGEALARKVLRSGLVARQTAKINATPPLIGSFLTPFIRRLDLNSRLLSGKSVLVEVPQGLGLGVNGKFYPHCTSRDCGPAQAANDAGIHHSFCGPVMLVLRTFPIRVGNIRSSAEDGYACKVCGKHEGDCKCGYSGGCYPDQREITWDELGVEPEITTVTKRVRRIFTWSQQQIIDAFTTARPTHVFLSHADYIRDQKMTPKFGCLQDYIQSIKVVARMVQLSCPQIFYSTGPTTADVHEWKD